MNGAPARLSLLAIAGITFVVFIPSLSNNFVDWDDNLNFITNPYYRGLGWTQLRWMLRATVTGHWIPATWLTLGLDYRLWGMNPAGYHLTNVVLHALNAVVFTLIAFRLLRLARPRCAATTLGAGSVAAALFFALHPLRAETVAWVTERRGLLSAFFVLLTVLTYIRMCAAESAARRRWLVASVGAYALALLSKAAVVPLPLLLLVLDAYPLGRLTSQWRRWTAPATRGVWLEKLPYAVLAGIAAATALLVTHARGSAQPIESYPPSARWAMLSYGLMFYLEKTVVPLALNPLYELPERINALDLPFLASIVGAAVVTGALWLLRRRWPAGLALWTSYALILIPVSGLFQAGHQLVADRYTYLSCLPWALLLGAAVCSMLDAAASGRVRKSLAAVAAGILVVWIVSLAYLTWLQVQVWQNTETLWRYALELDPACALCHNQLGAELGNRGEVAPAAFHFEQALALRPNDAGLNGNLGLALLKARRAPEAITYLDRALQREPANTEVRVHLGVALMTIGRADEGIDQLRQATLRSPGHARARYELARAYLALGDRAAAAVQAEALRRLDPRLAAQLK
jgi:Flp pilus assembly protein TadD